MQTHREYQGGSGASRKPKRIVLLTAIVSLVLALYIPAVLAGRAKGEESPQTIDPPATEPIKGKEAPPKPDPKPKIEELAGVREVTAYTLGNPAETDDTPCTGAYGHNLCEMVAAGQNICASNEFPAWTILKVGSIECLVLDRMHPKHAYRVDIAMMDRGQAILFGLKTLPVSVIKKILPLGYAQDNPPEA